MTMTSGVPILLLGMLLAGSSSAMAGPPTPAATARPAPTPSPPTRMPSSSRPESSPSDGTAPPAPVLSQDAAARARMHECGHQWSSMKKAGTAGVLTWKEFSATCLVVSK